MFGWCSNQSASGRTFGIHPTGPLCLLPSIGDTLGTFPCPGYTQVLLHWFFLAYGSQSSGLNWLLHLAKHVWLWSPFLCYCCNLLWSSSQLVSMFARYMSMAPWQKVLSMSLSILVQRLQAFIIKTVVELHCSFGRHLVHSYTCKIQIFIPCSSKIFHPSSESMVKARNWF